jgi:sulfide:quinone oxidoreductase
VTNPPRITVVGAGFAALTGVRQLRRRLPAAEITLVAPAAEFVYLPSLIWVPFGLRRGEELRHDLRPVLDALRVNFVQASATGVSPNGRTLLTDAGNVDNDALLIASGGRFIRKPAGVEHTLTLCAGIEVAETIGARLRTMTGGTIAVGFGTNPQEPAAMRGGPMFELLFGLEHWLRKQGKRDAFKLIFFNAAAQPGKRLGEKAVKGLLAQMRKRGIETWLGHKLTGFESRSVNTEGGAFPADLILFMPGMTGPVWVENSPLPLSPGGFIRADGMCQVSGFERVYVAGDAGSYPGPDWMPKQAHLADLQAVAAADNIARNLDGQAATAMFRPELVCIVDTLEKGILVYRDEKRGFVLPPLRPMHWAKRYFEKHYLKGLLDNRAA